MTAGSSGRAHHTYLVLCESAEDLHEVRSKTAAESIHQYPEPVRLASNWNWDWNWNHRVRLSDKQDEFDSRRVMTFACTRIHIVFGYTCWSGVI